MHKHLPSSEDSQKEQAEIVSSIESRTECDQDQPSKDANESPSQSDCEGLSSLYVHATIYILT